LKKTFYIAILLLVSQTIFSQTNFEKTDEYARNIEYNPDKSLAKELTKNCSSEMEKVRSIFVWITDNIAYDFDLYQNPTLQQELYVTSENVIQNTLDSKKAICSGYSLLFKSLCDEIGIECVSIDGYSRQFLDGFNEKTEPDHAWNAVKINNKWYLLDATWASGNGFGNRFEKGFDEYWFLTNPKEFIYTHFPLDSKWTLLNQNYDKEYFYDLPVLTSHWFFTKGVKVIEPKNGILEIGSDNKFSFEIERINNETEISFIATPWHTYATLNNLPEPTDEEFKKDPDKYNLVVPSIELLNKKTDGNKTKFEFIAKHKKIKTIILSIDGNQTAEYKVKWK